MVGLFLRLITFSVQHNRARRVWVGAYYYCCCTPCVYVPIVATKYKQQGLSLSFQLSRQPHFQDMANRPQIKNTQAASDSFFVLQHDTLNK